MSPSPRYDFVSIGNYTQDTIVSRAGTRRVDGGGYSYAAHAAVLAGLRVAAVTRLAKEDRQVTEPLRALGIDTFVYESPRSTLMRLEYPTDNVDERVLTVAAVAEPFETAHLGALEARAWLVSASVRGEMPLEVLRAIKARGGLLAVDVQGFVRVVAHGGALRYESWPEMRDVLELVDILKTDAVEAEFLTGQTDIHEAARLLHGHGAREIVLTHRDGLLVYAGGEFHEAGFHPEALRGRSGRGDTCVGSYTSWRIDHDAAAATRWAAAVTSLKLEAEGPVRRTRAEVEALLRSRYALRGS